MINMTLIKFRIGDEKFGEDHYCEYCEDNFENLDDHMWMLHAEEGNPDFDKDINVKWLQKQYGLSEQEAEKEFDEGMKQSWGEVNTSYDQDQPIGDEPQALNTELSNSEPIDAKTGQDFLDVNWGESGESFGMPVDMLTDVELIDGKDKLKGGFQNVKYLNQIEGEMRRRGMEGVKDIVGDLFSGNWIYTKDEKEYIKKIMEGEKFDTRNQQEWYYATGQTYLNDEPHENRKVKGESYNKDGTGVARATRGVNPNKSKHKVLRYIYVSKSDCPICKPYDGHSYAIDSPNRPIIPRLESQGKKGSRPYTHPNCKCKWVSVFSDQESLAREVKPSTIAGARDWAMGRGVEFDKLNKTQQYIIMIKWMKSTESKKFSGETGQAFHGRPDAESPKYGIQNMLDKIAEGSLGKAEKAEIEESASDDGDFTLDNILRLVVKALADKLGKKLGVESKAKENDGFWEKCPICGEEFEDEDDAGAHKIYVHELGNESDRCESCKDDMNDPDVDEYGYMSCKNCDREQGRIEDYGESKATEELSEAERNILQAYQSGEIDEDDMEENMRDLEKSNEGWQDNELREEWIKREVGQYVKDVRADAESKGRALFEEEVRDMVANNFGISYSETQDYMNEIWSGFESATEGGKGSGKHGHKRWMLGAESGEECSNCMMITEMKDGKCTVCGEGNTKGNEVNDDYIYDNVIDSYSLRAEKDAVFDSYYKDIEDQKNRDEAEKRASDKEYEDRIKREEEEYKRSQQPSYSNTRYDWGQHNRDLGSGYAGYPY